MRCVIALLALAAVAFAAEGWSSSCWSSSIGDGICDIECYSETNNFDNGDCDDNCNPGCLDSDVGDGYCDYWCMTSDCEYDDGDCGDSACGDWNCEDDDWGDGYCDLQCANLDCAWDEADCLYINCAPGCDPDDVGDGYCNWECYTEDCSWDLLDCDDYCSPGCDSDLDKGDGTCDAACYTEDCDWDDGDCDTYLDGYCYFSCLETEVGDGTCDSYCYNEFCSYDDGDCDDTYCGEEAGCLMSNIGDGDCDSNCNIDDCDNDGGDCDFAYVYYTATFTDDTCTGDVLTVSAYYYDSSSDGYCWNEDSTMTCGSLNVGTACVTVDDFDSLMDDWFDEDPSWSAVFPNPECDGNPSQIYYWTTAECVLIDNNLWGYTEWSSEGIRVPHICTDEECDDCFVAPEGTGMGSYYYDCYTDGYDSAQVSGASVVAAGLLALVFAVFAIF